jgi:hypothetical protein
MPKFSYKTLTSDGRFELVILGPGDLPETVAASVKAEDAALRAMYPRSGLYPANNTTAPVWTADEYWDYPTTPLTDGVHAVRLHGGYSVLLQAVRQDGVATDGRLPADAERAGLDAPAITFYARGRPLRTYTVRELVSDPAAVPHGPDRVVWCDGTMAYPQTLRYSVSTTEGNQIVFDVATGEIVGRSKTHRWLTRHGWKIAAGLAAVAVLAGVGWWRLRRWADAALTEPVPGASNA